MRSFGMLICCGFLGLAISLSTPTGWAAGKNPVGVTISVKPSHIRLTVNQPTPLVEVLGQLCRVTEIDCQGMELASDSTVAPLTVDGNWEQVTSLLMDGAGLNYIAVAPSEGGPGKLWITSLSTQNSEAKVATNCHPRRRVPGHTKAVSGQEDSCASGDVPIPEAGTPEPVSATISENTSPPEVVTDAQHDETAKSERGSGSPFPDGSGTPGAETQSQTSGSPFPESLATK